MISDGCMFVMPSGIQRRAPFTPLPTCGINTITSATSEIRKSFGAYLSHVEIGMRNDTMPTAEPISTKTIWRTRNAQSRYDAYFGESGIAIDAEYTITMPSPSSATTTHSSEWS
ncbi:hypothetical protein OKW34_008728 [Paraburkholderia youngii]